MSEWKEFLNEQLQDPELRSEWDALEPEYAIIQAIIDVKNTGLPQVIIQTNKNSLKSSAC